jgi:hypothetical protein
MRLKSLKIQLGFLEKGFKKEFKFEKNNLIHSDVNSVGKSSLLRLILYVLGFNIPSTKKLNFAKYDLFLDVEKDNKENIIVYRKDNFISITKNNQEYDFSLPTDIYEIHKEIFSIENKDVIQNLLGVFYVDQEKGWTLLNRGTPIGSNHFNIVSFIQGISNRSCEELNKKLNAVNRQIKKYQHMSDTAKYQKEVNVAGENIAYDTLDEELQRKLEVLELERQPIANEAKRLKDIIRKNTAFADYIASMKLYVKTNDGNKIPVNKETLVGFDDNLDYVIAKRTMQEKELSVLDNKISNIKKQLFKKQDLVNVETLVQSFDSDISKISINQIAVKNVIEKLEKEQNKIKEEIKQNTKENNPIISEMHSIISSYAKELGVDESYVSPSNDYIFTSDLKSLTGAIYHKIVFSFKLAYIKMVETYANCNLPIILDSPSGREIDAANISEMIKILNRDFSNHQIIIASIFKYDIPYINTIELKDELLGF